MAENPPTETARPVSVVGGFGARRGHGSATDSFFVWWRGCVLKYSFRKVHFPCGTPLAPSPL